MIRILHVVGARPNFMKIAPIMHEIAKHPELFEQILVHTGQHYDANMSQVFFEELELPKPDVNLAVGSGSHARQTAQIMERFEPILVDYRPDWVIVPGDVNSTLACALVASKLQVKVAHVEAGLRSFDRSMPEETNRILTDHLSDILFTTEPSANDNLRREGIEQERIRYVGNTMIDTLVHLQPKAEDLWPQLRKRIGTDRYLLATLHRPSNVDDPATLNEILEALAHISHDIPIIFPVHPRTRQRIQDLNLGISDAEHTDIRMTDPLSYLSFLALEMHAQLVVTDSGGIQEETTFLGIPCLTVRQNTERPVTITLGTNELASTNSASLFLSMSKALNRSLRGSVPPLWDGKSAERIAAHLGPTQQPLLEALPTQ